MYIVMTIDRYMYVATTFKHVAIYVVIFVLLINRPNMFVIKLMYIMHMYVCNLVAIPDAMH